METMQRKDEQARLAVEQELNVEMLPGTELLADTAMVHRVHDHNNPSSTVLIPQPSASKDDPLV